MPMIQCRRCGHEKPSLAKPPFRDALGKEVMAATCADCWEAWTGFEVKLMNELHLLPVDPEHSKILERNLRTFLKL